MKDNVAGNYRQYYAIDRGRSAPLKAAEGGANSSSSGETADGTYDLGLSPGCTLLLKAADGGTNSDLSGETANGVGGRWSWSWSLGCSSLMEATGCSNGDSGTDDANDGRGGLLPDLCSFAKAAGSRGLCGEFGDGTYDDWGRSGGIND